MQLLRDDAEINAKRGLDLIEKSAEALEGNGKLRARDSVISMIAQVMRRGARQARRLVETETSSTVGYHQLRIAHTSGPMKQPVGCRWYPKRLPRPPLMRRKPYEIFQS